MKRGGFYLTGFICSVGDILCFMHSFKLFGPLSIEKNGKPIALMGSPKACALLAYLAVQKRPQSREVIADLFWDALDTSRSLGSLRSLVLRTRRAVPELATTRKQLSFGSLPETVVDLHQLEQALTSQDISQIDQALALYQGEFLADFYLPDAPRFNDWLLLEREGWRQQVLLAYIKVCQSYLDQQLWREGVVVAQRWLALDPLDETALQFLLQFLANTGQGEQAIQFFDYTRQQLWDELGVEPVAETVRLIETIRQQLSEPSPATFARFDQVDLSQPSALGSLPSRSYVPYQRNPEFVGRDQLFLAVAQQFFPADRLLQHRAAVVNGMGGLGKTQFAVEFCYRYGRYFSGGVFWLSFADAQNVAEEVAQIGEERGMGLYREGERLTLADKIGRVRQTWQDDTPRLLIFDNCESEELLVEWLPVSGDTCVLVTSRRGHWSPDLPVLSRPLNYLSRDESKRLLQNLVGELEDSLAEEIATETGDLPLAIYLAGRFLKRYQRITPQQYLEQLRMNGALAHPSLQGHGLTHSPTQHVLHVARTFALNFDQLDETNEVDKIAMRFIASMVNFAHGVPLHRQLVQDSLAYDHEHDFMGELLAVDAFERLINLGLVRSEERDVIQIHRLVAAHIQTTLADLVSECRMTMVRYYVELLETQLEKTTFLSNLPIPSAHLQALTRVSLSHADEAGVRLARFFAHHLLDAGAFDHALEIAEAGIDQRDHGEAADQDLILAELYYLKGAVLLRRRKEKESRVWFEKSLAIRQPLLGKPHKDTAAVLEQLAIVDNFLGDVASAKYHSQQLVEIYEQWDPPNKKGLGNVRYGLGVLHFLQGELDEALEQSARSFANRKEALPDNSPYLAHTLNLLAAICYNRGEYDRALGYQLDCWERQRAALGDDNPLTLSAFGNLGHTESAIGRVEAAENKLHLALEKARQVFPPQHPGLSFILTAIGGHYCRVGQYGKSESYLVEGKAIVANGNPRTSPLMELLLSLAKVYVAQGNFTEAKDALDQFKRLEEQAFPVTHFRIGYRLWVEGDLATAEGDRPAGQVFYKKALAVFEQAGLSQHPEVLRLTALID